MFRLFYIMVYMLVGDESCYWYYDYWRFFYLFIDVWKVKLVFDFLFGIC